MKEQFINCYPLSKTLQFSLIPVGKTDDNFNKKLLLERDKQRAENYEKVKGYIDRFHKEYIESVLVNARVEKIDEYADLYWKSNKDDSDAKAMESLENDMRKQISKQLTIKLMHISVLMISRSFLSYMSLKFLVRIMKTLSYLSMKAHQHLW